jgi:hypothetical protein
MEHPSSLACIVSKKEAPVNEKSNKRFVLLGPDFHVLCRE